MRSIIIFYCPLYCATLPYAIFTTYAFDINISGQPRTHQVRFPVRHAVWATVVTSYHIGISIQFYVGGWMWPIHIGGHAAQHAVFATWCPIRHVHDPGVILHTYWHLLCCLSLVCTGLLYQFLVSGTSICICIARPINNVTVHANDVGTRQKKMQVNNKNIHCLSPTMSQAS